MPSILKHLSPHGSVETHGFLHTQHGPTAQLSVRPTPSLSTEPSGDIRFSLLDLRLREELVRLADLDQAAEIHERGVIGYARGLLHVVRHDHDRVQALQRVAELLDALRLRRVEPARPTVAAP